MKNCCQGLELMGNTTLEMEKLKEKIPDYSKTKNKKIKEDNRNCYRDTEVVKNRADS